MAGETTSAPTYRGISRRRNPEFITALKEAGYDGMAFGGSGETMMEMEWHVFDPSQAISVLSGRPLSADPDFEFDEVASLPAPGL